MSIDSCGQPTTLTVQAFTQHYRPAIGLTAIAVYKVITWNCQQHSCAAPTQETIAAALGCRRETVNRAIRRLVAAELLQKQWLTIQGRELLVYRPLIALCDWLSQGCDPQPQGCDPSSYPCALDALVGGAQNAKQLLLNSEQPSHGGAPVTQPCDVQSQPCDRASHDDQEDDPDSGHDQTEIKTQQESEIKHVEDAFINDHGRRLHVSERAVFTAMLQTDGLDMAEQVLARLRGQAWRSPNYLRAVWQDCQRAQQRQTAGEWRETQRPHAHHFATRSAAAERRLRYLPEEFADSILG